MARPTLMLRTLVATVLSLSTPAAQGAKQMPGGDSPTRQIVERFNEAFNAHDADALAPC